VSATIFLKRLLKQIRTIPLWSSIARNKFGYGRIPASSAPVEIEFNSIKNKVVRSKCSMDTAVEKLITYFNGSAKLIDCSAKNEQNLSLEDRECSEVENQKQTREPLLDVSNVSDLAVAGTSGTCFLCENLVEDGRILDDDGKKIQVCIFCSHIHPEWH